MVADIDTGAEFKGCRKHRPLSIGTNLALQRTSVDHLLRRLRFSFVHAEKRTKSTPPEWPDNCGTHRWV